VSADNPQTPGIIKTGGTGSLTGFQITATYWGRDVDVYSVFDHELQSIKLAASQSGLYLTFFGISFGAMLTLLVVLLTVDLTNPWVFAAFTVGFAVSLVATALLGLKARFEYKAAGSQFDYIENRSRGTKVTQPIQQLKP
jgi:hypothetical protein